MFEDEAVFSNTPVPPEIVKSIAAVVEALRINISRVSPEFGIKAESVDEAGNDSVASWTFKVTSMTFSTSKFDANNGTVVPDVDVALTPPPWVNVETSVAPLTVRVVNVTVVPLIVAPVIVPVVVISNAL